MNKINYLPNIMIRFEQISEYMALFFGFKSWIPKSIIRNRIYLPNRKNGFNHNPPWFIFLVHIIPYLKLSLKIELTLHNSSFNVIYQSKIWLLDFQRDVSMKNFQRMGIKHTSILKKYKIVLNISQVLFRLSFWNHEIDPIEYL